MSRRLAFLFSIVATALVGWQPIQASKAPTSPLPVFYFHGVMGEPSSGDNFMVNLTSEGRTFNELSFCTGTCSLQDLNTQVQLAIAQIREIIANDTQTYANGYVFLAYSQGGIIARGVIEEMDDHNVQLFVSLAGIQNGVFRGPQPEDHYPLLALINFIAPLTTPTSIIDLSTYTSDQYRGKIQHDYEEAVYSHPTEMAYVSGGQLERFPVKQHFLKFNTYLQYINNVNTCSAFNATCVLDKLRRRTNFLKLKAAHFFASPQDGLVGPWQTSQFGRYNWVATADEIQTKFEDMVVIDMTQTDEYVKDTFGLQTLDRQGALHLHTLHNVSHGCWVENSTQVDGVTPCDWSANYDQYFYPVLNSEAAYA